MKKLFLALFILTVFSAVGIGQRDSGKMRVTPCISVNGGWGIPLKSNNGLFETYGQKGSLVNISTTVPVKHSCFGIAGMISYSNNPFDINSYFTKETTLVPSVADMANFTEYSAMLGIAYTIPYHRFIFDFRLLGGALYFKISGNDHEYSSVTWQANRGFSLYYTANAGVSSDSSTSAALDIGASVKFLVTKRLIISLSFDSFYAYPSLGVNTFVHNAVTTYTPASPSDFTTTSYNDILTDVQLCNLTIGIGYKF